MITFRRANQGGHGEKIGQFGCELVERDLLTGVKSHRGSWFTVAAAWCSLTGVTPRASFTPRSRFVASGQIDSLIFVQCGFPF
jgi:hypothetical protein